MDERDIVPQVRLLDESALEFAARMTQAGRLGVLRLPFLEDAWGALEAGQPELLLEALHSLLENALTVYLASHGRLVRGDETALAVLRDSDQALYQTAWALASAAPRTPLQVEELAQRVMEYVELGLGVKAAVNYWAGEVTEPEYLRYRDEFTYPAILLAEHVGSLNLYPVPETYLQLAHEAREAGRSSITVLGGS